MPGGAHKIRLEDTDLPVRTAVLRAHGIVRVIGQQHAREQHLMRLANWDPLTGEMNCASLIELLGETIEHATRSHRSRGFLLTAIDYLGQLSEA